MPRLDRPRPRGRTPCRGPRQPTIASACGGQRQGEHGRPRPAPRHERTVRQASTRAGALGVRGPSSGSIARSAGSARVPKEGIVSGRRRVQLAWCSSPRLRSLIRWVSNRMHSGVEPGMSTRGPHSSARRVARLRRPRPGTSSGCRRRREQTLMSRRVNRGGLVHRRQELEHPLVIARGCPRDVVVPEGTDSTAQAARYWPGSAPADGSAWTS